jgi:CubicO group peptidase (beta-lactamase class C family)
MERPAYSNAAFNILAIALERFTGKNYTEMMAEYVCVELGMGSTHPSPGNSDRAVIPPGENGWGSDYGLNTPYENPTTYLQMDMFCCMSV